MQKEELRSAFANQRKLLSRSARSEQSLAIANNCLRLPIWHLQFYHVFLSIPERQEVDTSFLLTILQGKDKDVVVPRVSGGGQLSHYLLTDATRLQVSAWGIPEPVAGALVEPIQMDVVFLPLLAFDSRGYRVGYGGGYYDRFLAECRKDVLRVGLSFFDPVPAISDLHPADVPMDYCVTPESFYSF